MPELNQVEFWPFIWRSVYRAGAASVSFVGLDVKTGVTAAVLLLLGFGVYTQVKGVPAAKDQAVDMVLLTLIPTILFVSGLFLVNLFRAPYAIYLEEHRLASTRVAEAAAEATVALEKVKALGEANTALLAELNKLKAAPLLGGAAVVTPQNAEAEKLKRLADYLYKFEDLERRCIEQRGSDEVNARSTALYNEVSKYLRENLGVDYAARFKAATGNGVQVNYPMAKGDLLGRIRGRKQFLIDTMRDLRK